MILGGLKQGVNTLEMAHAYETLAEGGRRVSGTLAPDPGRDPIAFTQVEDGAGHTIDENDSIKTRVLPQSVADTTKSLLQNVISAGTGTNAQGVSSYEWGKTGTTDDNGDAWFCGATHSTTTCVWVGHADSVTPMETEFGGAPVDGGTIPALIWHDVMTAWDSIRTEHAAAAAAESGKSSKDSGSTYVPPPTSSGSGYTAPAPSSGSTGTGGGGTTGGGGGGGGNAGSAPTQAAPPATPAPTPAPSGGGSTGAGGVAPG
jgi:penicillin-binding protein 1A